ncbi:MAG TPA: FAD:protein FMN transferase, partial [Acidimicrobiales bacterium]|nr:FAD:protein FMN transferase [Acidimicrobiales bacterium]
MSTLEAVRFPALGTTATLVARPPTTTPAARAVLEDDLAVVDAACSRFRPDAELVALNAAAGRWVAVSPALLDAVQAALVAARQTDGAVDPTVGTALGLLGYDRDFAQVAPVGPALRVVLGPVPG